MVYSTRRFVLYLTLFHFVRVFFSPFSIAITSLGEERANLSAFHTFVRFVLVWICQLPLPLGVWEGLRFVDLNLCVSNGTVSTKIYDKRDDFDFDIVNFPFLDGDVPRRTSYGVYISQLIRFARASSNLNDFNYRNKALTAKLLRQGYCYFNLRKAFSKFYRRHSALLEKYSVSLETLLQQGISEPEFYGDLVYRFKKIVGKSNSSEQFRKLINRYKRIGYSLDIMRQTACLVVNPIIVDGYAPLFNCTICLWLGPPWFNYWLAYSRISHEYSSLFIIVIGLIFMFSL